MPGLTLSLPGVRFQIAAQLQARLEQYQEDAAGHREKLAEVTKKMEAAKREVEAAERRLQDINDNIDSVGLFLLYAAALV